MNWSAIRSLGNSLPARLAIFAPIVGYILLFNDLLLNFLKDTVPFFRGTEPETSPSLMLTLYLYYYGLFFFGMASALYQLFCHNIIKQFPNHRAYITGNIEDVTNEEIVEYCQRIKDHKFDMTGRINSIHDVVDSIGELSYDSKRFVMYKYYMLVNVEKFPALISAFFLYLIGGLLLVVPSLIFSAKLTYGLIY